MSKRNSREQIEMQNTENESQDECENSNDDLNPHQNIVEQILRTCVSCGSSANLFKTKKHKTCIECCNLRPKKTEKQLEAFSKARELRKINIERRKQAIQEFEDKAREELDNKIVKKAISIKKKQIKKNAELDEISDDDTPLEEVMKIAKKPKQRSQSQPQIQPPIQKQKKVAISEPEPEYYPQTQQQPQPQLRTYKFV
jgi:hypothetical protein